jgi:MFS transporter, ACS family, tartrate transporter
VPSNLILARVGARVWIARIMITWGLVAAAMMFVRGPLSFYGLRFLLGVAEAGFSPGILYYLSGWFPAAERARAVARFMIAIPLSGVAGGPISGALLGLNGHLGLAGWQWLFLLEGLPAVVLGFVVLGYLTDRPEEAAWLTPAERAWLSTHMTQEREQCERRHGLSVLQALSNGTVWQLGLLFFLCTPFGFYVLGLWLPQIVRGFSGLSDFMVGLVSAVPYLVAAVAMVLVGAHSDRSGERLAHIVASATAASFGFLASAYLHSPVLAVLALSVAAAALQSAAGPFWTLPSAFLSGSAAAGGIALINSLANVSGFVGPYVIGLLKGASGDFHSGLLLLALVPLAGAALAVRLRRAPVLTPS